MAGGRFEKTSKKDVYFNHPLLILKRNSPDHSISKKMGNSSLPGAGSVCEGPVAGLFEGRPQQNPRLRRLYESASEPQVPQPQEPLFRAED